MTIVRSSRELDDYRSRGSANPMGFGKKPALLVIVLSYGVTDADLSLGAPADDAIKQVNSLLDAAHAASVPVFFSTISDDGSEFDDAGVWRRKMDNLTSLKANTSAVEIEGRLHRGPKDALFTKRYASCFFGTEFASRLRHQGIDTLVVAGCGKSGCVRATAVDAYQNGLGTIVEAVNDSSEAALRQGLIDIEAKYGDVLSIGETLAEFTKYGLTLKSDNAQGYSVMETRDRMRDAMRRQTAPIAILATQNDAERAGILVTSVISVSLDPPSVLISINRSSGFYLPLLQSRRFSVNWLGAGHDPLVPIFSGKLKGEHRFAHGNWSELNGLPILSDARASFVCRVEADLQYGSHHVFIGHVEEVIQGGVGAALLWHEGAPTVAPYSDSNSTKRVVAS